MSDQREMTLDEYLESKLPDFHLARRQLQELREERDALAAHVERIHSALEAAVESPELGGGEWYAGAVSVLSDTPTASLARMRDERAQAIQRAVKQARRDWAREDKAAIERRDLLKQAEAFELAERHAKCELDAVMLRANAADLRRQAEESDE